VNFRSSIVVSFCRLYYRICEVPYSALFKTMRLRRQVLVLQPSSRSRNSIRAVIGTSCHVIQMLWLLYVSVGLAHAPAPMSLVLLFAWLETSWDAFFRYRMRLASWSHTGHVCLSDATCARDQRRKPCS